MKRMLCIVICLPFFYPLHAYESSLLHLAAPIELDARQCEFALQHRFYTPLEDLADTYFGDRPSVGVNPGLGLRFHVGKGIDIAVSHTLNNPAKGFTVGGAYNYTLRELRSSLRLDVEYFSFRPALDEREGNAFILLAWQIRLLENRIRPVLNIGYNHYNEKVGLAGGFGFRIFESLEWMGEYYLATDPLDLDNKNSFAFGFDYTTYGHHFMILVSNNTDLGVRRLMRGAPSDDLYFGFNIHRLLEF